MVAAGKDAEDTEQDKWQGTDMDDRDFIPADFF